MCTDPVRCRTWRGRDLNGICPDVGHLAFAVSDSGADDRTQMQRDAQSYLGGDECHHGTEGAVAGFIGDQ